MPIGICGYVGINMPTRAWAWHPKIYFALTGLEEVGVMNYTQGVASLALGWFILPSGRKMDSGSPIVVGDKLRGNDRKGTRG